MNPTIKALEERIAVKDAVIGGLKARVASKKGNYHVAELKIKDVQLERDAMQTLIDLHQDVEGDMPQDIWADFPFDTTDIEDKDYHGEWGKVKAYEHEIKYHRADTHINELTRRISDE